MDKESFLTFGLKNELFAASVAFVNNIIEVPTITKVPNTPDYLKGVINLRGMVLPIVDTNIKFNGSPIEFTPTTCILVLDITIQGMAIQIGALVDNVHEVIEIDKNQIIPPPDVNGFESAKIFIKGMIKEKERFIMVVKINKLFNDKQLINIEESIKKEELI